jgi:hypothetical protein
MAKRISEVGTVWVETIFSFEATALRATSRHHIPEDGILYCHRGVNLRYFKIHHVSLFELTADQIHVIRKI